MRIGLVTPYFPDSKTVNSGIANHFSTLAEALTNLGNEVIIIHIRPRYDEEQDLFEKQKMANGTILLTYKIGISKWLLERFKHKWALIDFLLKLKCILVAARKLRHIQREYQLNVIETSSYFSLCYLYLFTKPKVPVVTRVSTLFLQMMDNFYPYRSRLSRLIGFIEIRMIKKCNYLITHAYSHAQELDSQYQINSKEFHIIPHGINLPLPGSLYLETNSPKKILYVGRLEYRKGTDILLQAIPLVINKYNNVIFQLIGIDPEQSFENKFRFENNEAVNKKVIFSGVLDNATTHKAYATCDIFVAPSRYESFGLIYIEAMSYGKPVIGCKVGGVPEIIKNNLNGLFAEVGSEVSLAEKICYLLEDEALMKEMGSKARKTVEHRFSREILALNSIEYYEKAISTKHV